MTPADAARSVEAELGTFIAALIEVFSGEPWDEVEQYAARAWRACGLGEGASWPEIEPRIRAAWQWIQ